MDDFQTQSVPSMDTLEEQQMVSKPVSDFVITPPQAPFDEEPPGSSKWEAFKEFFSNNKWYVLALLIGVVIIGVLAYIAFRPQKVEPTQQANVDVQIDAPAMIPSGGEAIYTFTIENRDTAKLVDVELELIYDGMVFIDSSPRPNNLSGNSFLIPDLAGNIRPIVKVKVQVQGNINDQKTLVAKLKYKYSNFNSVFIKETSHTARIVASDIILDITGPSEVNNAQVAEYNISYRNNSDKEIRNGRIQAQFPEGFGFATSEPATSLGNNIWNINSIPPRGTGNIRFQGNFGSSRPGDQKTFKIEFLVADDRGDYYAQSATAYTTAISTQPLLLEQSVQGNTQVANPGDMLTYEIRFQNNGAIVATGVSIVVELDSPALDISSLRSDTGLVRDNSITWNASGVAALERLNPSDSGTVRFTVRINNPAVGGTQKNVEVKSSARIRSNEYRDFLPGNNLAVKISSPSTLTGSVQHIAGSLPPKVGSSSTYTVFVNLENSTNDFGNAVLSAFVPLGVNLDANSINARERGQVKYDASTGRLTWELGQLAAHAGSSAIAARTLSFNVQFTPSSSQANQTVSLLRNLEFTARDTFTDQAINLKLDNITTQDGPGGSQNGRVQN